MLDTKRRALATACGCLPQALLALTLLCGSRAVPAQGIYPDRPVRVIVPYSAGGTADLLARVVAPRLSEASGRQFTVEDHTGAAGIIGTEIVAKAAPDGYTLLMTSTTHTMIPGLFKRLPFDPMKDFSAVSLVGSSPLVITVNPSVPAKTVGELVALAKAKAGQINFASTGYGSSAHLAGALFRTVTGTNIVYVSYKDQGQAFTDLIGGQVQLMFPAATSALPHVRSGRIRGLAITGQQRSALAPEMMTVMESGLPGYDVLIWSGLLVPARTPQAIVDRLHATLVNIMKMPDVRASIFSLGADPMISTPAEFEAYMNAEVRKWTRVTRESNIYLD